MKRFLIYLALSLSVFTAKGQFIINSYAFGSGVQNLLLDSLSASTPTIAVSLRLLDKDYTGPLVKIRCSTTTAEATVLPDFTGWFGLSSIATVTAAGSSGYSIGQTMTVTALVASQDATVVGGYNQPDGAFIATQSTSGNQPKIITAGALEVIGTKPAMRFTSSSSQYLNISNIGTSGVTGFTGSAVFKSFAVPPAAANGPVLGDFGTGDQDHDPWMDSNVFNGAGYNTRQSIGTLTPNFATATYMLIQTTSGTPNGTYILRTQGVQRYSNTSSGNLNIYGSGHRIGSSAKGGGFYWNGWIGEFIVWKATLSTQDRDLLEANQKRIWGL